MNFQFGKDAAGSLNVQGEVSTEQTGYQRLGICRWRFRKTGETPKKNLLYQDVPLKIFPLKNLGMPRGLFPGKDD